MQVYNEVRHTHVAAAAAADSAAADCWQYSNTRLYWRSISSTWNKIPEVPPTAPPRQEMYEVIIDNGATNSNEINDEETVDNVPNSNSQPSPLPQTEMTNVNDSNPTPANANTVGKDMSNA